VQPDLTIPSTTENRARLNAQQIRAAHRPRQTILLKSQPAPNKPPVLLRNNKPQQLRKGRGRPKKDSPDRQLPLSHQVPWNDHNRENLAVAHPMALKFKHLQDCYFEDETSHRVYEVVLVYYDRQHKKVAAFRRVVDDLPPDPFDVHPYAVEGPQGVAQLVQDYFDREDPPKEGAESRLRWPQNEAEMAALQAQDPVWESILDTLTDSSPYTIVSHTQTRKLYRPKCSTGLGALRLLNESGTPHQSDCAVLPSILRPLLLRYYHDDQTHPGTYRTLHNIRLRYWWPGMYKDVVNYVSSCQFCRQNKASTAPRVPVQPTPSRPRRPFTVAHMDLTGLSLPITLRGHTCILVVKCRLTRYVEIIPLKGKSERAIANALIERIYLRHGAIETIITDNGTEFVNKLSAQINALLRIKHITTTPYTHKANGEVEAHNRVLMSQLSAYCNTFQNDWDNHLQLCAFTYNTTPNTATGFSPHYMVYGQEASQPHSQWIESYCTDHPNPTTAKYMADLVQRLQFAWDYAADRKPAEGEIHQRLPLTRLPFKEFEVGDWVFIKSQPKSAVTHWTEPTTVQSISSKLSGRYTGPYQITHKTTPVRYMAWVNGRLMRLHASQLKPVDTSFIAHVEEHETTTTPTKNTSGESIISVATESPIQNLAPIVRAEPNKIS
jgi:transposase InsO family protein